VPDPAVWLEAGAKALLYTSLLLLIGANGLRWLLLPRCEEGLGPVRIRQLEPSLARLALRAALCALGACALRVWTHTVSAFGFADANWDNLKLIALQSRWGQSWKLQAAAAVIAVIACAAAGRWRAAWLFETLAVLLFTATIPLLGHAAGDALRVGLHGVHILAAGIWLGSLAVTLLLRISNVERDSAARTATRHIRLTILRQFWPVALPSAATTAVAGLVAAYLYVGTLSNLWTTAYGRMLLLKVALVGAVAGCGFVNWRRLRRTIPNETGSLAIVLLEAFLAVAVVLVTALLTETGHPG